ncbi:MAG: response regulator [Acidimicrobiia bacterium]|nr:response regulator [Acidimicrobiia bacterium]
MIDDRARTEPPRPHSSKRQLMTVASIMPEAFPSEGSATPVDTETAAQLVDELLAAHLEPPATRFPGVGDEIVCVFPDLDRTEAAGFLETARLRVRNRADIPDVMVSFSAGLAADTRNDDRQLTLDTARLLRSDAQAKGGDRVQIQTEATGDRRTILLAEDDTLTDRLIIHRLQREGYVVVHHPDGQSALEAAQAAGPQPYALAIFDVKMPRMDGFELLGRFKEDPNLASTPVVMLTGMGAEQDVVRALSGGADDYILKPFSPTELALRVQRLLAK